MAHQTTLRFATGLFSQQRRPQRGAHLASSLYPRHLAERGCSADKAGKMPRQADGPILIGKALTAIFALCGI